MKLVTDPKYLRMAALKELGGDIEQMETGSIIIRLVSVLDDQWNSLKQKCYSGEIKDFITAVYKKEGVVKVDDLEEGCYHIDVKIFREIIQTKDAKSESGENYFYHRLLKLL